MLYGAERGEYPHEDLKSVRGVAVNQWHQPHGCSVLNRAAFIGTASTDNLFHCMSFPWTYLTVLLKSNQDLLVLLPPWVPTPGVPAAGDIDQFSPRLK